MSDSHLSVSVASDHSNFADTCLDLLARAVCVDDDEEIHRGVEKDRTSNPTCCKPPDETYEDGVYAYTTHDLDCHSVTHEPIF